MYWSVSSAKVIIDLLHFLLSELTIVYPVFNISRVCTVGMIVNTQYVFEDSELCPISQIYDIGVW